MPIPPESIAPLMSRVSAKIVDGTLELAAFFVGLIMIFPTLSQWVSQLYVLEPVIALPPVTLWQVFMFLLPAFILFLIQSYFLTVNGQSIGKMSVHIRIVQKKTGMNGGLVPNVLVRTVVNGLLSILIPFYALVDVIIIFADERRCIHDYLAGTVVVNIGPTA